MDNLNESYGILATLLTTLDMDKIDAGGITRQVFALASCGIDCINSREPFLRSLPLTDPQSEA